MIALSLANVTSISAYPFKSIYCHLQNAGAGKDVKTGFGWGTFWVIALALAAVGVGGYAVYKYRIRVILFTHSYLTIYFQGGYKHTKNTSQSQPSKAIPVALILHLHKQWNQNTAIKFPTTPCIVKHLHLVTIMEFICEPAEIHGFGDPGYHGAVHALG